MNVGDTGFVVYGELGVAKVNILEINLVFAWVERISLISFTGKEIAKYDDYGKYFVQIEDLFDTVKNAYSSYYEKKDERIEQYCEQITTIKDLVNFSLQNGLDGWKNNEKRLAYIRMANKLLGYQII